MVMMLMLMSLWYAIIRQILIVMIHHTTFGRRKVVTFRFHRHEIVIRLILQRSMHFANWLFWNFIEPWLLESFKFIIKSFDVGVLIFAPKSFWFFWLLCSCFKVNLSFVITLAVLKPRLNLIMSCFSLLSRTHDSFIINLNLNQSFSSN